MAKIKQNNFIDTVNEVFTNATEEGILHLCAEGENFTRRIIKVKNRKLFHFGTTGYLNPEKMIGVMLCYKNNHKTYVPAFVGMDYKFLKEFQIYRQLLYQTIKRAIEMDFSHIELGLTASFEKRKLGATVEEKYAYIQTSDNFNMEFIDLLECK